MNAHRALLLPLLLLLAHAQTAARLKEEGSPSSLYFHTHTWR